MSLSKKFKEAEEKRKKSKYNQNTTSVQPKYNQVQPKKDSSTTIVTPKTQLDTTKVIPKKIEVFLDKQDHNTITELCNRVILQLKGKAEKVKEESREFSNTWRIVEKAKQLKLKITNK